MTPFASRAQSQQNPYANSTPYGQRQGGYQAYSQQGPSPYSPGGKTTQFGNSTLNQTYTQGASPWGQQQRAPTSPTDGNWANFTEGRPSPFTAQYGNYQGGYSDQPQTANRDAFIQQVNNQAGRQTDGAPQFDFGQAWGQANQMVADGWQNPFAPPPQAAPQQDSAASIRNLLQGYGIPDNVMSQITGMFGGGQSGGQQGGQAGPKGSQPGYGTPPEHRNNANYLRTQIFRDRDGDGVDDRDQDGPGMPAYGPVPAQPVQDPNATSVPYGWPSIDQLLGPLGLGQTGLHRRSRKLRHSNAPRS